MDVDGVMNVSSTKKVLPFEDEDLKLPCSLARRVVFKPLPSMSGGRPLFTSSKEPSKIVTLNLTREHFKPGGSKFRDLTPEAYNLVAIFFNSLSFAFDQKKRLSTTPVEKKKANSRANQRNNKGPTPVLNAEADGGGVASADANVQSEAVQVEKEQTFINGGEYLTVYIETLLEQDPSAFKVGGFRLWVLDASNDKSGLDLLTKGVKETLIESACIQKDVQSKLDQIAAKQQASAPRRGQKQFALNHKYSYTSVTTDEMLINSVSKYFAMDGLLSQQQLTVDNNDDDNDATAVSQSSTQFIDNRPFMVYNSGMNSNEARAVTDSYRPVIRERVNTMYSLFGKEQAMVYHVEKDGIRLQQRTLASYFGENSDDIGDDLESRKLDARNPLRLCNMIDENVPDREFRQFPYPSITYQIDPTYLSFDVFAELPLPHRLGTYLYTTLDLDIASSRLARAAPASDDADHNGKTTKSTKSTKSTKKKRDLFGLHQTQKSTRYEEHQQQATGAHVTTRHVELASDIKPLGIYDCEYQVNVSRMHMYGHYMTPSMRQSLSQLSSPTAAVPRHVRDSFVALITSDIRKGLMAITNQVDKPNKAYIVDASHNRAADLPYLEAETKDGSVPPFRSTSVAYQMHNRDKRHLIDSLVYSVLGNDDNNTVCKEKNKNLSTGNGAYFRSIIAQRRPVDATVENALACMGASTYDRLFLERDIYLVLDVLNRYGYAQIDKEFFDPKTKKVRKGRGHQYIVARRAFTEAIIIEFYDEFFTNGRVSLANIGIRNDLLGIRSGVMDGAKHYVGMKMPVGKFNMQVRPFHAYKMWVYSYFVEHDGINHNYKTSDILFHARYHHCRSYPPQSKDPKMNVLLSGQGTAGKSHKLGATKDACPSGVAEGITHMTNQSMNVDQNMNDMLIINEEMSNKLIAPSVGKGGQGTSEAANDDARNNFKERATAGVTVTLAFFFDEETGERKARISKCQCQNVILGATNNDLSDSDPNVMSRFIIISVPRSKNDVIGNRPQDKQRLEAAKDEQKTSYMQEQVREVHRIYYMVECMIKSGTLGNTTFGVAIDGAQIYMTRILDLLQSKYGIATNDIRKRKHVIEMARCMCISFACWYGLTSPLTRHLQYDVYTNEFIGFNPRVLLDGIMPYLVVTKDMVINAISCLSCLWGHEYMDQILRQLATSMCQLDKLRQSDFVRRPRSEIVGPGSATMATSAFTTKVDPNKKSKRRERNMGGGGAGLGAPPTMADADGSGGGDDPLEIDYNYISVSAKSHPDIHNLLSNSLGDLCVAPNDIAKVLRDLGRTYIQTPGYMMSKNSDGDPRLVKSDNADHCIPRRIVDYGGSQVDGLPSIAISVAFLKQKLPHLLPDSMIEDLTQYTFGNIEQSVAERDAEDSEVANAVANDISNGIINDEDHTMVDVDDDEDDDDDAEMCDETVRTTSVASKDYKAGKALVNRMMDAITLRPGTVGESSVIKAIRDVLENSVLEFNPHENPEQEKLDFKQYSDVFTGQVPWFTYVTSEHPQPLLINALFPDLKDAYSKVHGNNKDIILSDKIAMLQLKRKKNGIPLVYYNYNTVSSSAKSSFSIFDVDPVDYPTLREGETDPHAILEVQELDAIRAENARFEEVHKNRFAMFANNPVFPIDRDLDYTSCADHLRNIGYPMVRDPERNRLVNYPPHMCMNLDDFREQAGQRAPPLVPLYSDIQERIETTKKIIEANCGIIDKNAPRYAHMIDSNYEREDLLQSLYPSSVSFNDNDMDVDGEEQQQPYFPPVVRRSFAFRASEKQRARDSVLQTNKRYGKQGLGEIVNTSHYMTNKRPVKKAKV